MTITKRTKRNGFYYRNGKEYVSVTKVLGETLSKPALMYWYGSQAAKIALKDPELNDKEVMAQLQLNVRSTQDRGKAVHNFLECWAKDGVLPEHSNEYQGYLTALKSFLATHKPKALHSELEVYSDEVNVAGRLDLVIDLNSVKGVVDIKTGKDLYKEVGLQLAFYKQAMKETCEVVDKTWALLLREDGSYMFQEYSDTLEDFKHVLAVWHWLKKKGEI